MKYHPHEWYIFPAPLLSQYSCTLPPWSSKLRYQEHLSSSGSAQQFLWDNLALDQAQQWLERVAVIGIFNPDTLSDLRLYLYVQRLVVGLGNTWISFEHGTVVQTNKKTNRPWIDLLNLIRLLCMSLCACACSSSRTPLGPTNMIVPFSTTISGSFAHFWKGSGSGAGCPDLTWNKVQRSKGVYINGKTMSKKLGWTHQVHIDS